MADRDNRRLLVRESHIQVQKFERSVLEKITSEKVIKSIIACCPEDKVRGAAFTPNNQFLAVAIDQSVLLWDLELNKWVQKLADHNLRSVNQIEITPDGKRLIAGDNYKVIEWDFNTGRIIRRINTDHLFALSLDGKTLVVQERANYPFNRLGLWNLENDEKIKTFGFPQNSHSTALALSPDGKKIAVAEFVSDAIRIFDLDAEKLLFTFPGHSGYIHALTFTPDGKVLISGSDDHTIRFWHMEDGTCFRVLYGHSKQVNCLAVSPDGKTLISGGGEKMIHVFDLQENRLHQTLFGHESAITTLTISPDGQRAASGGGDGRLYLWDLAAGEPKDLVKVSAGCAAAIACSSSGQIIASFSRDKRTLNLKKYNLKGQHYDGKLFIRRDQIKASIAIHPEGSIIAVGMRGCVCLYDTQSGLKKSTIGGFEGYVRLTAFSPDGSKLLAGSGYEKLRKWTIYDLQTGELTLRRFEGGRGKLKTEEVAFLPDGASFLSVSYDSFDLWDFGTGRCERVGGEGYNLYFTRAIAVHPVEKTFITGGYPDGNIHDWDLETGKHLRTFAAHTRRITALAFSQDGKLLLSGCEGGIVHYWDYKAGRLLATGYNVDAGYLWTTPSDAFAEEGWLYTNRTDLVSLAVIDQNDDSLEYLKEDDERFKNYLRIYNDGDMVMARIYDWERYQKLLSLRINNKEEEEFAQIEARAGMERYYQLKAGRDSTIEKEES